MSTLRRVSALAVLICALCACSQSPAPGKKGDPAAAQEQTALAPLKSRYNDVITGLDAKDRTLTMYVEPNAMYSMDEDAEYAMKAEALERWKKAWADAHPHQHGVLRLVVRDYFGREISTSSAAV